MKLDIEAATERCEEAPEGPWEAVPYELTSERTMVPIPTYPYYFVRYADGEDTSVMRKEDAEFIAAVRTDLPAALERIAELTAENARLKAEYEKDRTEGDVLVMRDYMLGIERARASEDAAVTLVEAVVPKCRCGALATYATKHRYADAHFDCDECRAKYIAECIEHVGPNPAPCSTIAPFDPEAEESNTADCWAKKLPHVAAVRAFTAAFEKFHHEGQGPAPLPSSSDETVILRAEMAKWTRRAIDDLARAKIAESDLAKLRAPMERIAAGHYCTANCTAYLTAMSALGCPHTPPCPGCIGKTYTSDLSECPHGTKVGRGSGPNGEWIMTCGQCIEAFLGGDRRPVVSMAELSPTGEK
jgi:hypothetical protein